MVDLPIICLRHIIHFYFIGLYSNNNIPYNIIISRALIEHCSLYYFMMVTLEIGYALVGVICLSGARPVGRRRSGKCNHRRNADIDGI